MPWRIRNPAGRAGEVTDRLVPDRAPGGLCVRMARVVITIVKTLIITRIITSPQPSYRVVTKLGAYLGGPLYPSPYIS